MTRQQQALSEWQLVPFHLGAAIGPMGGGVLAVLFAILLDAFAVDRATLSLAVPAYMLPYAGVQLISGSISDLTSRRSSLLLGFGGYGAATMLAAVSPTFGIYLVSQVLQGVLNAFTTPILMATLGDVVPRDRLGRSMGFFSSANLAGAMGGPLLAGAFGGINWRLSYVAIALITWGLMAWYALWFRRHGHRVAQRVRRGTLSQNVRGIVGSLGWSVLLLASLAFFANAAMRGPSYLFAEYLRDIWGTGVGEAGIIVALYGFAGLLGGPGAGWLVDRVGPYRGIAVGSLGVGASLTLMGLAPSPLIFGVGNFLLGLAGIVSWSALNTLAVRFSPENRGTVTSIFGSAKFLGQALAPLWFTPLYGRAAASILFVAALLGMLVLAPLGRLYRQAKRPQTGGPQEQVAR